MNEAEAIEEILEIDPTLLGAAAGGEGYNGDPDG